MSRFQSDQHSSPRVIYNRGGRGIKEALGVKVTTPDMSKTSDSEANKWRMRRRFRSRVGFEPIIRHLKTDHRMGQTICTVRDHPKSTSSGRSQMEFEEMDGAVNLRWRNIVLFRLGCIFPAHLTTTQF